MPHIRLEYSGNLGAVSGLDGLFAGIHDILSETAGIRRGNCKSRVVPIEASYVGSGQPGSAFVHLEVRILEGRPGEVKRAVGQRILSALKDHFRPPPDIDDFQVTVEVRDIQKDSYLKFPEGTLMRETPA